MGTVHLTIDDAPSSDLPEKVAILDKHDVPAVFFCEGRRLASHPENALAAVEAGYHLGNHTYTHPHASALSVAAFRNEIVRTETRIENIYDCASITRPARLFRFPYGDTGGKRYESFQEVLREHGFLSPDLERLNGDARDERHIRDRDWSWTFTVEDWSITTETDLEKQIESTADQLDTPASEVVLFHDTNNSVNLFASFVDCLRKRDVSFGNPLELLDDTT